MPADAGHDDRVRRRRRRADDSDVSPVGAPPFPEYMRVAASSPDRSPRRPRPFRQAGSSSPAFRRRPCASTASGTSTSSTSRRQSRRHCRRLVDHLCRRPALRLPTGDPDPARRLHRRPRQVYPISFDLSQAREGLRAEHVSLRSTSRIRSPRHAIVLQSPSGTAVMLMANAGGDDQFAGRDHHVRRRRREPSAEQRPDSQQHVAVLSADGVARGFPASVPRRDRSRPIATRSSRSTANRCAASGRSGSPTTRRTAPGCWLRRDCRCARARTADGYPVTLDHHDRPRSRSCASKWDQRRAPTGTSPGA